MVIQVQVQVHECVRTVALLTCKSCLLPLSYFPSALSSAAHGPVKPEDVAAKQVDLALVDNFVPRMARQWEAIGIQLHQGVLVNNLRLQNHDPRSNCTQVLHEAKESGYLPNYGTLLKILRSDGVCLSQVASELQQAVVVQSEKEREPVGQPADSVSQPSSSPSTPTDDSEDVLLLTPQTVVHDQ